jgi:hypothetical protein
MSNFESTFGSERVLKAQTEPFPVLVSQAIASCAYRNCGSRTSHHRRIDISGAAIFKDLLQAPF